MCKLVVRYLSHTFPPPIRVIGIRSRRKTSASTDRPQRSYDAATVRSRTFFPISKKSRRCDRPQRRNQAAKELTCLEVVHRDGPRPTDRESARCRFSVAQMLREFDKRYLFRRGQVGYLEKPGSYQRVQRYVTALQMLAVRLSWAQIPKRLLTYLRGHEALKGKRLEDVQNASGCMEVQDYARIQNHNTRQ